MAGHLEAARTGDTVYVRVIGLGNFNNAGPLREYCEGAFGDGFHNIIVDLEECTGLDSTFMGTMIGFLSVEIEDAKDIVVTVVNATPPTRRALNNLGLPKILPVQDRHVDFPKCRLTKLREGWQDQRRRTLLIKDAHVALMKADRENQARFGPFVDALIQEVKKQCEDDDE
ncbi:MAG: STAS domain-containing protein [Planctomycetota bacterium]|jgi:anti-anti-sigma regulatory factor